MLALYRRPVYASLNLSTDELTLATFEGDKLAGLNRGQAIRLAFDILDLFQHYEPLFPPSEASTAVRPPEQAK